MFKLNDKVKVIATNMPYFNRVGIIVEIISYGRENQYIVKINERNYIFFEREIEND